MTVLEAVWLGIVQGISEFLPISSDGHLSLLRHFLNLNDSNVLAVTAFLHLGTLLAIVLVFGKQLWALFVEFFKMLYDLFRLKAPFPRGNPMRRLLLMFIISCVPLLLVIYYRGIVEQLSSDTDILIEGLCFVFTGAIILLGNTLAKKVGQGVKEDKMSVWSAIAIGIGQLLAVMPGISRSGCTISAGLMTGLERDFAFEYSFVLGAPAILAAGLLEIKHSLTSQTIHTDLIPILVGVLVSAVVGYIALRLVGKIVKSGAFGYFGYYCLALGIFVIAYSVCIYCR